MIIIFGISTLFNKLLTLNCQLHFSRTTVCKLIQKNTIQIDIHLLPYLLDSFLNTAEDINIKSNTFQ